MPLRCFPLFIALALVGAIGTRADEPAHPIFPVSGSGSGADAILTGYSEAQFLRFVPTWAPRDPTNGFARAVVAGDTGWTWNLAAPDQLTSTPSGTVFPNASYTLLTAATPVLSGRTSDVPYYLAAGNSGTKSFVPSVISFNKRAQLRKFLTTLAAAYVNSGRTTSTRNQAYARRVALALDGWADYVPDYFMTPTNTPTLISAAGFTTVEATGLSGQVQRASDHNGLAHEWEDVDLLAFDAIYDSSALDQLSVEKGHDVRQHIKDGLFFNIGDFIRDRVPVSTAIAANLSSPYSVLAKTARVLNRPDYILWMGDYLDATVRRKIDRDGVLPEGIGYSYNYGVENIDATQSTRDYFLSRPADTPQLKDISLAASRYVPMLQRGVAAWDSARLPDGTHASFGDTNFDAVTPRNAGNTVLLPSYGHLAFGTGAGAAAVQLNQNFSDDSNHMRADVTAFTLWANGAELLGNVRYYNALAGRQFTEQILAHNAVTIDRTNMSRGAWTVGNTGHRFTSGNLVLFEPMNNGLSVSEIDGQRAYADKASRYQRLMILNTVDPEHPYVIDVFRVTGGTTHDYTLHGAIRFDQTAETSFALTSMSGDYPLLETGETWVEPTTSGSTFPYYGFFRSVSQGTAGDRFQITYRDAGASKRDLRLWMTGEQGATVYVGKTPNPSRDNTTPPSFYTYWRPSTIVRHRSAAGPLESLYAAVMEPLASGVGTIADVNRVPLTTTDKEAVALRVSFTDGRVDTYLVNLRNPNVAGANKGTESIATADGEFALTGRVGAYVSRPAAASRIWMIGGTSFKAGATTTTNSAASYSGNVIGMTRKADGSTYDAFVVDAALPAGTALQGRQLSLTFGDYRVVGSTTVQKGICEMFEIDHVEQINGQTVVVLTVDHQLRLAGTTTTELVAPERTFTGPDTFQIVLSSSAGTGQPVASARLVNLSILTRLPNSGDSFTLGYVVGGGGTSAPKPLVIRAAGPSLGALGVPGALDDPQLELFTGATKTGENDNWGGSAVVRDAMAAVGAFPYMSASSRDAAVLADISAGPTNSVRVSAHDNGTGTVIAEIYDATPAAGYGPGTPRLINVSVLKHLGTPPALTVGFVIGGSGTKTVLIRAIGPTLGLPPFGVNGVVADPQLAIFHDATPLATNDNWGGTPALTDAFTRVGAFALPAGSLDAALLTTLSPGSYSVQVSGSAGTTGVALVEVYEVP